MFEKITAAPADPILGLTDIFRADDRAHKINLGIGVYKDETGKTPVLTSVKKAEQYLLENEATKIIWVLTACLFLPVAPKNCCSVLIVQLLRINVLVPLKRQVVPVVCALPLILSPIRPALNVSGSVTQAGQTIKRLRSRRAGSGGVRLL